MLRQCHADHSIVVGQLAADVDQVLGTTDHEGRCHSQVSDTYELEWCIHVLIQPILLTPDQH